jgi:hypothetical protein
VVSFFADFTYEGSRSVTGPFLETLGASGAIVGIVAGLGELLGYGLRFFSGRVSERTRQFWPMTLFGYFVQMAAVPALALAGSWQIAAVLIVLERVGKAIRNPPRDVMLSHAGKEMGIGWAFGLHEGLDQAGALLGPLMLALILAHRGEYRVAFATLLIPACITVVLIVVTKFLYPRPEDLEPHSPAIHAAGLGRAFWIYLVGAALVAAGFADYQLIAFHLQKHGVASAIWIPIFYSVAMATSGAGSLLFGKTVRPVWRGGANPAHFYFDCVGAAGVSGRVQSGARRSGGVGAGDGRARVDHSGSGGCDGARGAAAFGLWALHCRVWGFLVPGQRGDWISL